MSGGWLGSIGSFLGVTGGASGEDEVGPDGKSVPGEGVEAPMDPEKLRKKRIAVLMQQAEERRVAAAAATPSKPPGSATAASSESETTTAMTGLTLASKPAVTGVPAATPPQTSMSPLVGGGRAVSPAVTPIPRVSFAPSGDVATGSGSSPGLPRPATEPSKSLPAPASSAPSPPTSSPGPSSSKPTPIESEAPLLAYLSGLPQVFRFEGMPGAIHLSRETLSDAITELLSMGSVPPAVEVAPAAGEGGAGLPRASSTGFSHSTNSTGFSHSTGTGAGDAGYRGISWLVRLYNKATTTRASGGSGGGGGGEKGAKPSLRDECSTLCCDTAVTFISALLTNPREELYCEASRLLGEDTDYARPVPSALQASDGSLSGAAALWVLLEACSETEGNPSAYAWGERAAFAVSLELLTRIGNAVLEEGVGTLDAMLAPCIVHIYNELARTNSLLNPDRLRPSSILATLCKCPPLARGLVRHPLFIGPARGGAGVRALPPNVGAQMENGTILGLLLAPSSLPSTNSGMGMMMAQQGHGLSPPSPILGDLFNDVFHRSRPQIVGAIGTSRDALHAVYDTASNVFKCLLKVDAATPEKPVRDALLNWIFDVLTTNGGRAKEHVMAPAVANDGFFLNLSVVLARLCHPIWEDASTQKLFEAPAEGAAAPISMAGDKLNNVESLYLCSKSPALGYGGAAPVDMLVSESGTTTTSSSSGGEAVAATGSGSAPVVPTTTITASAASGAAVLPAPKGESEYKFVTLVFFYTVRALQLGLVKVITDVKREHRTLGYMQHQAHTAVGEAGARAKDQLEGLFSNKAALDVARQDPMMLVSACQYSALMCEFVGRICGGTIRLPNSTSGGGGGGAILSPSVPFPEDAFELSKNIPEYFVSTPLHILTYVGSMSSILGPCPEVINQLATSRTTMATILHLYLALLASPKRYIRSPHLRAEMGDSLYGIFLPENAKPRDDSGVDSAVSMGADMASSIIVTPSPFCAHNLAPALMALYGDVEATGFYDKAGHRMKVASILNYIWSLPPHKPAFHDLAVEDDGDSARFVSFANGLIGHTTAQLDKALEGLPVIRETLAAMANVAVWAAEPEERRSERERELEETTQTVKSAFMLSNQTTSLMAVLTEDADICEQLMRDELVDRLAAMLMNALTSLAGPKGVELKVDNPGAYNFRPKQLLLDTCTCIVRFARRQRFLRAVAECGFFLPTLMDRVQSVVVKHGLLPDDPTAETSQQTFLAFIAGVQAYKAAAAPEEGLFEDFPEEFRDLITQELMSEPVRTPSGHAFDRASITQHIMNAAADPLTRQPLSTADLVPDTALKARIEAWMEEKRAEARATAAGAGKA